MNYDIYEIEIEVWIELECNIGDQIINIDCDNLIQINNDQIEYIKDPTEIQIEK
jgi:hypothetical protein